MLSKIFVLLLVSAVFSVNESAASILPEGSHCVAYKAKKRMFLVKTVAVVGKNCKIISQVIPDLGGLYSYKLEIPIKHFESGEEERDKDVKKVLKMDKQDALYFKTESLSKDAWKEIFENKEGFVVKGFLNIAGRDFPVKTKVKLIKVVTGYEVDGTILTNFEDFDIKPPVLFGGIMAKVKNGLELHYHIKSEKTLGFESLL